MFFRKKKFKTVSVDEQPQEQYELPDNYTDMTISFDDLFIFKYNENDPSGEKEYYEQKKIFDELKKPIEPSKKNKKNVNVQLNVKCNNQNKGIRLKKLGANDGITPIIIAEHYNNKYICVFKFNCKYNKKQNQYDDYIYELITVDKLDDLYKYLPSIKDYIKDKQTVLTLEKQYMDDLRNNKDA